MLPRGKRVAAPHDMLQIMPDPLSRRVTKGFGFPLKNAGTRTDGVIRCDQPHAVDPGARNGRRVETVPDPIIDDVPARLNTILS